MKLLKKIDKCMEDHIFAIEILLGAFLLCIGFFFPIINISLIGVTFILMGCFGKVSLDRIRKRRRSNEGKTTN